MKSLVVSLSLAAAMALATPVSASSVFTLPSLSFPEAPGPTVSKDCNLLTTPGGCERSK